MKLISTEFNFNSSIESIFEGIPNGSYRSCIVAESPTKKSDIILQHASRLKNELHVEPFLAVAIPFGSRPKRIELCLYLPPEILLFKFSDKRNLDQSGLDLQESVDAARGCCRNVVLRGMVCVSNFEPGRINTEFTQKHMPDIDFADINLIYTAKSIHGISHKSQSRR
jgi:hypothetical protein